MFIAWCIAWALNQCDWILLFSGLYFKIRPASRFSFVVIILFYYIVIVQNKLFLCKRRPMVQFKMEAQDEDPGWEPQKEIHDRRWRSQLKTHFVIVFYLVFDL